MEGHTKPSQCFPSTAIVRQQQFVVSLASGHVIRSFEECRQISKTQIVENKKGSNESDSHATEQKDSDDVDTVAKLYPSVDKMVPDSRIGARVLNACGELSGLLVKRRPTHPAWRKVRTLFGVEWHAYTASGNIAFQFQRVLFKGATDPESLRRVERRLFGGMVNDDLALLLHLKLIVTQVSLGRSLYVNIGCQLDRQIEEHMDGWASVCSRCEELCNVVPFRIIDWARMLDVLGMEENYLNEIIRRPSTKDPECFSEQIHPIIGKYGLATPRTAMVSVTRRGVLTLRVTWDRCVPWVSNAVLLELTERLGRFVCNLV